MELDLPVFDKLLFQALDTYRPEGESEMIGRVAKSIVTKLGELAAMEEYQGIDPYGHESMREWRLVARAAIEAMREPTEEMIQAGFLAVSGLYEPTDRLVAYAAFVDMIDAALTASPAPAPAEPASSLCSED